MVVVGLGRDNACSAYMHNSCGEKCIYVCLLDKTAPMSGNINYSKHNLKLYVMIFRIFIICDKWTGNMVFFQLTNHYTLGLEDLYLTKRINRNIIYIHTNILTQEHLPVHIHIQLTGICIGSII